MKLFLSYRFREASVMYATLSCDHRVIDGAVGELPTN